MCLCLQITFPGVIKPLSSASFIILYPILKPNGVWKCLAITKRPISYLLANWRRGRQRIPVLDTTTGLHNLELSSNIGDGALDDVVEIHHWCLADELRLDSQSSEQKKNVDVVPFLLLLRVWRLLIKAAPSARKQDPRSPTACSYLISPNICNPTT
jgi:hypothetical protein